MHRLPPRSPELRLHQRRDDRNQDLRSPTPAIESIHLKGIKVGSPRANMTP